VVIDDVHVKARGLRIAAPCPLSLVSFFFLFCLRGLLISLLLVSQLTSLTVTMKRKHQKQDNKPQLDSVRSKEKREAEAKLQPFCLQVWHVSQHFVHFHYFKVGRLSHSAVKRDYPSHPLTPGTLISVEKKTWCFPPPCTITRQ
jgi:hypothetical protein